MLPLQAVGEEQVKYQAWLSSGENLSQRKVHFSQDDKIYLIVRFQDLASKTYTVDSHWINPEKNLEQQNTHTFSLKNQSYYTYYAWLSLLQNGPMTRMFVGSDIDRRYQGTWQVLLLLDGRKIDTLAFDIY